MQIICSAIAAIALLVLDATCAAADHGYWPAQGVTPAEVTGHAEATDQTTKATHWGPSCTTAATGGSVADGALDVYGALLTVDYDLAVIGVAAVAANFSDPDFQEGPYGLTLFESPKEGEFVWADADGDGRFTNRHEADSALLIVCTELPATDTATATMGESRSFSTLRFAAILAAFVSGVVLFVPLVHYVGRRRQR